MDQLRTCLFIREYIRNEVSKGYDHSAVLSVLHKRFDTAGVGAKFVTLSRLRRYSALPSIPIDDSLNGLLAARGFRITSKSSASGKVIVFANNSQLEHLVKYGCDLVLMDACGSLANIYLVTLLARDDFRCWLPVAQFWVTKEHSDLYVQALKTLQDWTGQRWCPSAFLIDGSRIEALALGQCFHSSRILRCTRHSTQTLKSKLSHTDDLMYLMERAVFAETQAECHRYIQECLNRCPYADLQRYILTAWTPESSCMWSLYSRLDTPILQEITTINACESYHSLVRRCTNRRMDVKECTLQIVHLIARRYDSARAVHLEHENRISRAALHVYPQLTSWPPPHQRLVSPEITMAERMIADGSWKFQWFQAQLDCTCRCKFFRTHGLPCKHIFVKDLSSNKSWITPSKWSEWRCRCSLRGTSGTSALCGVEAIQ